MKKKTRLNIQLKLWHNDKLIVSTNKRIKSRILSLAQVNPWERAFIKITYDDKRGFINAGEYDNLPDLKFMMSAFTEKVLIDFILNDKEKYGK